MKLVSSITTDCTLIFDVGKTHIKLILLDDQGILIDILKMENQSLHVKPYTNIDVDRIWEWFKAQTKKLTRKYAIEAVSISAHGACAALVDLETCELVLPVTDYEFDQYPKLTPSYETLRPPYFETYSPKLPGGLNLGRQLYYQMWLLNEDERRHATILLYANYWAWRLTGVASTEITSLGCHTDLWDPQNNHFSSLAKSMRLVDKFPPMINAWIPIGTVLDKISHETGLDTKCRVMPGVHDSNAGYIPYIDLNSKKRSTVVSTGTWVVAMSSDTPLAILEEQSDMLANVDISRRPLATARYMGGREFEEICRVTKCGIDDQCAVGDIEYEISERNMALPSFIGGCGPFPDQEGKIIGKYQNGKALATLYASLMLDHLLTSLRSSNDIIIEGSFAKNEQLCSLLAALRPSQKVYINADVGGIVDGCFRLAHWNKNIAKSELPIAQPFENNKLAQYAGQWRSRLA